MSLRLWLCPLWLEIMKGYEKNRERFFPSPRPARFPGREDGAQGFNRGDPAGKSHGLSFRLCRGFRDSRSWWPTGPMPSIRISFPEFARKEGFPPDELLKKISVARAFTCHQLATLVRERLETRASEEKASLVVLLGPCTLFSMRTCRAKRPRCFSGRCWPACGK